MRQATNLFELDFVFSQRTLLTPSQFITEYQRREIKSSQGLVLWEQLEALHEAQMLVPMYRFVKNVEPILSEAKRRRMSQISIITQQLGDEIALSHYLHGYNEIGRPIDPRTESFESWSTYGRKIGGHFFWTSTFFLLTIPNITFSSFAKFNS